MKPREDAPETRLLFAYANGDSNVINDMMTSTPTFRNLRCELFGTGVDLDDLSPSVEEHKGLKQFKRSKTSQAFPGGKKHWKRKALIDHLS